MTKKADDISNLQPGIDEVKEMARVIPIRTESVLCHYPIHKLSKDKKPVQIKFTRENNRGKVETTWKVSPNAEYGQPGELAYKLDTLVINRLIDELRPDIPEIIKIAGSLRELSELIGKAKTGDTTKIKNALYQNAFAAITARLEFTGNDNAQRTFEFGSTRYGIIFIGERLPNGKTADAIYLVLNPIYRDVLRHARTRPLDYAYLKALPPSSQRLYELIAPQIFAALKNDNPRAKYLYSEFCQRSTLTRYFEWDKIKKQLYKVHKPHIDSGYLKAIEFEETTDANNGVDWIMWYTPGRKAKAEFKRFNTKEGRELEKLQRARPKLVEVELLSPFRALEETQAEESDLVRRMIEELGISFSVARTLEASQPHRCLDWCEAKIQSKELSDKGAGFFVKAIVEGWELPSDIKAKKQRAEKRAKVSKAEQLAKVKEEHAEKFRPQYWEAYLWSAIEETLNRNDEAAAALRADLRIWEQFEHRPDLKVMKCYTAEEFFKSRPELSILDFWQWDAEMNAEPFQGLR